VTRSDDEVRRRGADRLVRVELEPNDLVAASITALAKKRNRVLEIELAGARLDSLVRVAKGGLVLCHALGAEIPHR
jgi:hypothetical protein